MSADTPATRPGITIALAAPYLLVLAFYTSVSRRLLIPGLLVCAFTAAVQHRIHRKSLWRYPAGWLLSLLLIVPCAYLYVYERIAVVGLVLAPGLVLLAAHLMSRGAVGRFWNSRPMLAAATYIVTVTLLLVFLAGRVGLPPVTDDMLFGLYEAPSTIRLNQAEMDQAVAIVESAVREYDRDSDEIPATIAAQDRTLPQALRGDRHEEVWVTMWVDRRSPVRGHASGGRLFEDLSRAADEALDGTRRYKTWVDGVDRVRIQIDLADKPVRLERRVVHHGVMRVVELCWRWFAPRYHAKVMKKSPDTFAERAYLNQLFYEVEPGVDGLILNAGDRRGTILPGDPVTRGWLTPRVQRRSGKLEAIMRNLCREARGSRDLWSQPDTELSKFRSFCFGRPVPGGGVVEYYRGNVLVDGIDSHALVHGIEEAGRWLLNTVKPDATFDYEYYPNTDSGSKDYNIVRHAGCVYGLFHMYNLALVEPELRDGANDYLEAGIRAMDWVYDNLDAPRDAEDPALVALIDERGRASSGAAALTLLSLLERPDRGLVSHPVLGERLGREDDQRVVEGLGEFLLFMVDEQGRVFKNHRDRYRPCKDRDGELIEDTGEYPRQYCDGEKEPLYYPGESMLALVRLHVHTGDERWLEGARRIGDWQVERYYARRPNPDHWVMQALWVLYQVTEDESYARAALHMGDRHASEQFPPHWPPFRDYFGAYRRFDDVPRTTRACSRSEAMGGVVHTAWKIGADPTVYEDALLRAADHLLENQWRPQNSWFLPNPDKARGAIRMGLVDNHCRIDNNQHAVVGLHRALEVARKREGVPMPTDEVLPPPPTEDEQRACRARFGEPAPDAQPEGDETE
jgi:hypothetical protein